MVNTRASAHDRSVGNDVRQLIKKRGKPEELDLHLKSYCR